MTGSTHMAGGAVAALTFLTIAHPDITQPHLALAAAGVGIVGGLLPDIDHPNSIISKKLKPVSALVTTLFSHRGLFHAPALYLIFWALWLWKCPSAYVMYGNCAFAGIASHLALDFLNPMGIPLFLPFDTERRNLLKIRTGGKKESIIRVLLYLTATALLIFFYHF